MPFAAAAMPYDPPITLALIHCSGRYNLSEESLEFSYQACLQPDRCFNPTWHGLPTVSVLTVECYRLAQSYMVCFMSWLSCMSVGLAALSQTWNTLLLTELLTYLASPLAVPAIMLLSGNCSLVGDVPKFLY